MGSAASSKPVRGSAARPARSSASGRPASSSAPSSISPLTPEKQSRYASFMSPTLSCRDTRCSQFFVILPKVGCVAWTTCPSLCTQDTAGEESENVCGDAWLAPYCAHRFGPGAVTRVLSGVARLRDPRDGRNAGTRLFLHRRRDGRLRARLLPANQGRPLQRVSRGTRPPLV